MPRIPRPEARANREDTRQALIRYGTELLTGQGFASTGIDKLLRHLGVPKGSFYHYFPSKEAFGLAVVDNYREYFARKLDHWLGNESLSPLARLQGFMESAAQGMARHDFRRGCLAGNLSQEFGNTHPELARHLDETFRDWQARVAACLREAQRCGELPHDRNTEAWAEYFWTGWEGAVMRAKLTRSDAPLTLFATLYLHSLKTSGQLI